MTGIGTAYRVLFLAANDDQAVMRAAGQCYMTKASGLALGGSAALLAVLGRAVRRRKPIKNRSYERLAAVRYQELIRTIRFRQKRLMRAFDVLIGLLITLTYLLSVH